MPLRITARNEVKKRHVLMGRFERAAKKILKALGWKHAEVSVLLTSDPAIRKINRKFLGHDDATDVIAFPGDHLKSFRGEAEKVHFKNGISPHGARRNDRVVYIGDIVISLDTAAAQCKAYGNTFSYEVLFYLCHGVLHLMGHDDSTLQKSKAMHRKQAAILRKASLENFRITK